MMRLRGGIEEDVYLGAPLLGAHPRLSQSRRIQDGPLVALDALEGHVRRTTGGLT
jgi:hypothetical protein